ncbi:MAG TPA: DUF1569 domain-containing protein [Pirellulales bacterium]|nr:DUF1569 domain-containing protein [Pirellulales bacterium]
MSTVLSTAQVNSAKVTGRRELHFSKLADIQTDAENLAARPVRQLGNWQLGYALAHLSGAMKICLDGANFKVPFYIRWFAPLLKKKIISSPMKPGFKLPEKAAETLMPSGPVSTQEGLDDLRKTIDRLNREPQRQPSPVFGPMTHEEWDQLHLRHAELHLSFFVPE